MSVFVFVSQTTINADSKPVHLHQIAQQQQGQHIVQTHPVVSGTSGS